MPTGPTAKLSLDKKHIWIDHGLYTFEQAKEKAHEILDLVNGAEDEKEITEAAKN